LVFRIKNQDQQAIRLSGAVEAMIPARTFDPRSFRDPDGALVVRGQRIFRLVEPDAARRLDDVLARPVVAEWMRAGKLIETHPASASSLPHAVSNSPLVAYEHARVPFVSYAHEWSPAMLAEAARFTLELSQELLRDDLMLKDATPANVLFRGSQPVFVDILSIVPRGRGSYLWLAANQFEATFMLPLIANAEAGVPLSWSLQDTFAGVSHSQIARLLGARRWLKPSLLTSVAMPAALSSSRATSDFSEPRRSNDEAAKFILQRTLARYERQVRRLKERRSNSFWKRYTDARGHYTGADLDEKKAFVSQALEEIRPDWTLDVGANTGEFSAIAAKSSNVVAIDIDESSVSDIFQRARTEGLNIQPLVGNFARPAPALGWLNGETQSFLQRARERFDLVLMLAVVHHLRTTSGIPLPSILDTAATITTKHLLIEHVPPTDPMFRQLARGRDTLYQDCTIERFEAEFATRFEVLRKLRLQNGRMLYLGKRLNC
jgi:SAM-dependent methyltransferase